MKIISTLESIRKRYLVRRDGMDDGGWKTINGTHVLIDEVGEMVGGPQSLREWNKARREKSGTGAKQEKTGFSALKEPKEILARSMEKIGMEIVPGVFSWAKAINGIEFLTSALTGIEDTVAEVPELKGKIFYLGIKPVGIFSSSGHSISINEDYNSIDELNELIESYSGNFWPPNTTPASMMAHECTHCIEQLIIDKQDAGVAERIKMWNESTIAKEIVSAAARKIKRTPFGKGKKIADLISGISRYATKNRSETMAEAFADCYQNGENANPFSKAIKEEMLRRLRK